MSVAEIIIDLLIVFIGVLCIYTVLYLDYHVHRRIRWRIVITAILFVAAIVALMLWWIDALAHLSCMAGGC